MIVVGADEIAKPLSVLVARVWRPQIFLQKKIAKIAPVYKSGERSLMENYRTISVLPVLSKVNERIIHQQLYVYFETNELLSRRQFGFRKGSSTQHAVTLIETHSEKMWTRVL